MKRVKCAVCEIEFGLADETYMRRVQDGRAFCCPNGHRSEYRPSENETLREALVKQKRLVAKLRRDIGWLRQRCEELGKDAKHWRYQALGFKGQWALLKKRIEQGDVHLIEEEPGA